MRIRYIDMDFDEFLPKDIDHDWYIFNATRPIYGHKDWQDVKGFSGWFFAAIDPESKDAQYLMEGIESMDGALIRQMPSFDVILNDAQGYADAKGYDVDVHDLDKSDVLDFWINKLAQKRIDICEL